MNVWSVCLTPNWPYGGGIVGAMIVVGIETVATGKAKPSGRIELDQHDLSPGKGADGLFDPVQQQ